MEPKMRSKGEIMMLRRQQAEERRMVYEKVKTEDRKAFANASWQEKTVRRRPLCGCHRPLIAVLVSDDGMAALLLSPVSPLLSTRSLAGGLVGALVAVATGGCDAARLCCVGERRAAWNRLARGAVATRSAMALCGRALAPPFPGS
jgi:hypothetical protein